MQSSFHFIVVADDSYVICMIFRSQGGCGRPTAGSAGDYPEEEEVAKEAVKSKVVFKMKKGLVKMSCNFSLYRLLA